MPAIPHVMLKNFRNVDSLRLNFQPAKNVLIGDNEWGKISVLLVLAFVQSVSRHQVETLGAESLFSRQAVMAFRLNTMRLNFSRCQVALTPAEQVAVADNRLIVTNHNNDDYGSAGKYYRSRTVKFS